MDFRHGCVNGAEILNNTLLKAIEMRMRME